MSRDFANWPLGGCLGWIPYSHNMHMRMLSDAYDRRTSVYVSALIC
jgi:hypothetical protein